MAFPLAAQEPGEKTILVAEAVPAIESAKLASLRLQTPSLIKASLNTGFSLSQPFASPQAAPAQPALTQAVLASYVARQNALKSFNHFDVPASEALTETVLLSYIAKQHNPALDAIEAADTGEIINASALSRYVETGYQPTVKKIELAADERECLAQAIYHEARGEGEQGQWAVANIIINRAMNKQYPSTICGVVYQNAEKGRYQCQFTFACDGRKDKIREQAAWDKAIAIADGAFAEFQRGDTPGILPKSALFYHTTNVAPSWSRTYKRVAAIGSHVFYSPL